MDEEEYGFLFLFWEFTIFYSKIKKQIVLKY